MSRKIWSQIPRIRVHKPAAYYYQWHPEFEDLPKHFRMRAIEFQTTDPEIIHYKHTPGEVKYDHFKQVCLPVSNNPVPLKFPDWSNESLLGGEGVIYGFRKPTPTSPRLAKYWFPFVKKEALYSEILDEWFAVTVTDRTLYLIDKAFGFDHYILGTHERHLNSKLAMKFRKKLLIALASESIYPDNPERKKQILRKYKKYIVPLEEAEWVGLTVYEAVLKNREMKNKEKEESTEPFKDIFIREQFNIVKENFKVS